MSNELIIVKQLPQIEEHLKERSEEIEKKVREYFDIDLVNNDKTDDKKKK